MSSVSGRTGPFVRVRRTRARLAVLAAFATLLTTVAVDSPSPAAAALTNCPGGVYESGDGLYHCYLVNVFGPGFGMPATPLNEIAVDLHVPCIMVSDVNNSELNFEMWMYTNQNITTADTYWVEEGLEAGTSAGVPAGWSWFWADSRPNGGGYHGHYIGGGTTADTQIAFKWLGNANWDVYRGGSYINESINNGAFAEGGMVGAESTTGNIALNAAADNFEYADPNWNWHGVQGALWNPYAGPLNGYLTTGTRIGTGVAAYSGNCPNAAAIATPQPKPLSAAAAPSALRAIGLAEAQASGDAKPSSISYISTTRPQADKVLGTATTGDNAVYVIRMTGHFTAKTGPVGNKPTGTVMTVTVSAATGRITDWGITDSPTDLSRVGQLKTL